MEKSADEEKRGPLQDRMAELVRHTQATHGDLVRVMGVSSSAVSQILNGPTRSLGLRAAVGLERAYGFSALWLALGEGPKRHLGHWRAVAEVVARVLEERQRRVSPRRFFTAVDVFAESFHTGEGDDAKLAEHVKKHMPLID